MKNLLSKALLAVVMDKPAREKLERVRAVQKGRTVDIVAPEAPPAPQPKPKPARRRPPKADPASERLDAANAALTDKAARGLTPDRQRLIAGALKVRNVQQKVLDDLSPEQRQRLYDLAMRVMAGRE